MKELEWKEIHENHFYLETGNVSAFCRYDWTSQRGRRWWNATVSISPRSSRSGPNRCSLAKALEDAARMIEEQLLDLSIGVAQELKNYEIEHDTETR